MAGSFGYESEHYALSMTVGGDHLFPAVRAEPDDIVAVATGTPCRRQILHGTGRRAWHPLEIARAALRKRQPHAVVVPMPKLNLPHLPA
ncbi:hypothetical protein GCM10010357_17600 [Streptomyces luteireticuli]|uniref:Uncharacterized protein n=1 Tax=Streptomyces luteireticuli TaxID=173858 RepID=A0ABN0YJ75_9ACTN